MANYSFEELIELSKNDKNTDAQFALGNLYFYGSHEVKKNIEEGVYWYMVAGENGDLPAIKTLYNIYSKGIYLAKDLELSNIYKARIELVEKEFTQTIDDLFIEVGDIKEKVMFNVGFYESELSKSYSLQWKITEKYFEKYKNGHKHLRDILVVSNLKLISEVLSKIAKQNNPFYWDYFQVGIMALLKCVEGFEIEKGFRFSTYAYMSIKRYIFRAIQENAHIIHKPAYLFEEYGAINKERKVFNSSSKKLTMEHVCNILNIDEKKYINIISAVEQNIIGLDFENDNGGVEERFSDFKTPESILLEKEDLIETIKIINKALPKPLWREVIKRRNGIVPYYEIETLEEIAKQNSVKEVSRERIRQIEKKALDKLKIYILRQELEEYINEKQKKKMKVTQNKPCYISNTIFDGDKHMIITESRELIKYKLLKVKSSYEINPFEALHICKEAIEMQKNDNTLFSLVEEKDIYELAIKLCNYSGIT